MYENTNDDLQLLNILLNKAHFPTKGISASNSTANTIQIEIAFVFLANCHYSDLLHYKVKSRSVYEWSSMYGAQRLYLFMCSCATPFPSLCGYTKQGSSVWAIVVPVSTWKVLSGLLPLGGVKCLRLFCLDAVQKHEAIVLSTGNYKVNPAHTWIFGGRRCCSWYA